MWTDTQNFFSLFITLKSRIVDFTILLSKYILSSIYIIKWLYFFANYFYQLCKYFYVLFLLCNFIVGLFFSTKLYANNKKNVLAIISLKHNLNICAVINNFLHWTIPTKNNWFADFFTNKISGKKTHIFYMDLTEN